MAKLTTVRRVTIVVDAIFEQQVLQWLGQLGARGYTLLDCRGRGGHLVIDDSWFGGTSRVRIETIVLPEVAEKIVEFLDQSEYHKVALAVCVENIDVLHPEKFA